MLTQSQTISIIVTSVQSVIIIIGFCLQIKTYFVVRKEKDLTGNIYIFHGAVMVIYFTCCVFLQGITEFITLEDYTGIWFCYIASFIKCIGNVNVCSHSLCVAVVKYIFIINHEQVLQFGEMKARKMFFYGYVAFTATVSISFYYRPGWEELYPEFYRCYHGNFLGNTITKKDSFNLVFCELNELDDTVVGSKYIIYLITQFYCFIQFILGSMLVCNFVESFFYFGIFRHIQRYA